MSVNDEYIEFTIPKQKTIALIAHDKKKKELVEWCEHNKFRLEKHFLCGTGTSARLVAEKTGLPELTIQVLLAATSRLEPRL